jgi:hypothetical protein
MLGSITVRNGLYRVEHEPEYGMAAVSEKITVDELHRRMGHIAPEAAKRLVKDGLVDGIELDESVEMKSCDSCAYAKSTRKPIRKDTEKPRAKAMGDEIHSDLWGPAPVRTPQHKEYYVSFTDDYSRFSHVYLLRGKDQTFENYKAYEALLNTQYNVKVKTLHTDRGGEFLSDEFTEHLNAAGTTRNLTVHDTPEHNGIAERLNRTLLEKVRAMLHASGLPKNLWGEAVKHAVWLKNRTSTRALPDNKTPYEMVYNKKPNLANLHEFGTKVWVHDSENSKLEGRSRIGRWLGYDTESSGHRIYWPDRHSIGVERSVKFDEFADLYMPGEGQNEGEE